MTAMKSDTFDVDLFETRLEGLKDTQEGIQQMSSWCLQQRAHHKKIVASWLNVLKKVRVEHRLVMFYLANDVIQYSKRKHYDFVETWATALQRATTMVRDEKVKGKVLRIFGIWEQREIFSEEYISDLHGLLNINPQKKSQPAVEVTDDFQNTVLTNNIRECVELSNATDLSFKKLPKAPSCDIENIKHQLKDKSHSEDVEKEIERYITYIEAYNKNLQTEIKSRKAVLSNLETAIKFYSNQRGEVKVVVSAYKNFGSRIKLVKKKLDEISPNLPSPIPSPDINAPSPERDADLQLPDEQNSISLNMFKGSFNGFSSYLDGNLPFDINDFKRDENKPNKSSSSIASQPIEVIATRPDDPDPNDSFNRSTEYYKPESISAYPGGSNVEIPGLSPMPVPPVQSEYSSLARSAQQYGIIAAPHPPIFGGGRSYTPYNNENSYLRNNSYNGSASNNAVGSPLMPPPMPPTALGGPGVGGGGAGIGTIGPQNEDFNSTWDMSMSWSQLDSSNASSAETPVSPPHFERRGHNIENTTAYVEHDNTRPAQDVDHRQLHLATGMGLGAKLGLSKDKTRQLDIDHRNLISLTGSPSNNDSEADKKSWPSAKDKDFRSNKLFTSGDVDYRSGIGVVQAIQTIDTIPMPASSMKPPPMPPTFLGFDSPNKILTQKSSSPHKSNASSSSESQREDAGGGYDPADMVVDMDMSDEDLDDIFREVNEENEEQLELSQTSSTADISAATHQSVENAGENLAALHSNNARPPLLETPPEYVTQNNMWDQTPPFRGGMGIDNMQEHQLEEEPWNEMAMPYGNNVGGSMYPPPPRPPFHMPQHMQQQHDYPHPQAHFMGGDRGSFGGPPGRGRGRGWAHSPQNPFRNSQRPPRGGGGLGSPYFNRGGRGVGGMRGAFRGKFRGNNAWI